MIKENKPKAAEDCILQFPHCDAKVLHAPGECQFCDNHPDWQRLREVWGICFTGYKPENKELPDPASNTRGLETVNKWYGNIPKPPGDFQLD